MSAMLTKREPMLSDRERELAAIIRAYNDVTDRLKDAHERLQGEVGRLREELHRKNEELRRRERLSALGEMAAGLAHEIRNPLGGIALYASMLERSLTDRPKDCGAAERIAGEVRSLERLVSEILDFAQEDRLERQSIRLGQVLEDVAEAARPWASQCHAEVSIDAAAGATSLFADARKLKQVLLNLVINGLQAAGRGGRVVVATERATDGAMRIIVRDNGPGIPPEVRDRIFNPFFTTKDDGTGLGLAIVHRIIEAHGGAIRAFNSAEGGAVFEVTLPEGGVATGSG
jgi:signal transduction histidine kinase